MENGLFNRAESLGFGYRLGHIGHNVANSSPPLRHFFGPLPPLRPCL